jgi:hypothetical protein
MVVRLFTATSWLAYPIDENTRVAVGEAFIEKWPVSSVS